jgi:hypothetical protein
MHFLRKKKFHTTNKYREQINFKRDRNQFNERKNDRDNKRKRNNDNDNDNDEKHHSNIEKKDDDDEHNIYIVINLNILTIMSVIFREIIHWVLHTICFQHNIRDWSIFISYTFFSEFVRMNDFDESAIMIEQKIVRIACKIDIKRIDIFFLNAFYVSKCFLNLIIFDQLNDLCSMTYKSKMFFVEDQNIITKKRVNNVFFFLIVRTREL